ncbi:MAG: hypothetical protein JNM81_14715 [Rhodospirillaceae bacterium]|nr:hypothetical protein [Rhodospirillaceae bacterium]
MSKDLNTAQTLPEAVQSGGVDAADRQVGRDANAPAAANSNQPETDAEEVAEVYFALG